MVPNHQPVLVFSLSFIQSSGFCKVGATLRDVNRHSSHPTQSMRGRLKFRVRSRPIASKWGGEENHPYIELIGFDSDWRYFLGIKKQNLVPNQTWQSETLLRTTRGAIPFDAQFFSLSFVLLIIWLVTQGAIPFDAQFFSLSFVLLIIWLVVSTYPSEKYEWKSGMMKFPTDWKNKIHVPNHQPVVIYSDPQLCR